MAAAQAPVAQPATANLPIISITTAVRWFQYEPHDRSRPTTVALARNYTG
ncbi:MAG TPA: hypothetical protein VFQ68_33350 [Streptosporangiaceae bacterium]|nr:hypothetical protein [Streptosporangiaceae bacterium]